MEGGAKATGGESEQDPPRKEALAVSPRKPDRGLEAGERVIHLSGFQQAVVRIIKATANRLPRLRIWEKIVTNSKSFRELVERMRSDIFTQIVAEPAELWDELLGPRRPGNKEGDEAEATGEVTSEEQGEDLSSRDMGIIFLTNHERQVDIIALLAIILERIDGRTLGVVASDLLNLNFTEIIPVRIMGLIGDKVNSFRDLFNIALARTETVQQIGLGTATKMALNAAESAIDLLSNKGIVVLAPSAGKDISKRENWGNFLSLMLRKLLRSMEGNSSWSFKLVLVEASGVRLAPLLVFPQYKTRAMVRIRKVIEVKVDQGDKGVGATLILTSGEVSRTLEVDKTGEILQDGEDGFFQIEDIIFNLWHGSDSDFKGLEPKD